MKTLSVESFRKQGYLQELNRRFLHPLGLALEVIKDESGNWSFGNVWDYRDDPEGIIYGDDILNLPETKQKAGFIDNEIQIRQAARINKLGYWRQPLVDEDIHV